MGVSYTPLLTDRAPEYPRLVHLYRANGLWSSCAMTRSLALAILALLALPSAALANPSISVSSSRDGSTSRLPAKVKHRLTLTAGATAEAVTVSVSPSARLEVGGNPQTVTFPTSGTGPGVAACPGRWIRLHNAYRAGSLLDSVTLTLAPGATAFVEATVTLVRAPWADETLDASWLVEPAQGSPFDVISTAPRYRGPIGVQLAFGVARAPDGHYVVTGTTDPSVNSGRVELWAYPPRRNRAKRIARVRVREGSWSFNHFMPDRTGRWELYARYRAGGRTFANDTSECGTFVRVR